MVKNYTTHRLCAGQGRDTFRQEFHNEETVHVLSEARPMLDGPIVRGVL
jgi:hypothetical protein